VGLHVVYAGTAEFAVPALEALHGSVHPVLAVYTQPDRGAGRGRTLKPSAVKRRALELALPVLQPVALTDPAAIAGLAAFAPQVIVVAAYGLLLPRAALAVPRLGCLNIHASLLPRWRGAAPGARASGAGDEETGVCIMRMEETLDTGPLYACRRAHILASDRAAALSERLAREGAALLVEVLDALAAGDLSPAPQAREGVSYARKLSKREARIDWREPAPVLERRVRAFDPWPVAETTWQGQALRVWAASTASAGPAQAEPGTVLAAGAHGIDVATGAGVLRLERVQLPGRKPLAAADFLRGLGPSSLDGQRLGP